MASYGDILADQALVWVEKLIGDAKHAASEKPEQREQKHKQICNEMENILVRWSTQQMVEKDRPDAFVAIYESICS